MPKSMELVQRLLSLNKPYFTLAGLEKVRGQSRPSLYVTLNRLVSHRVLVRLRRDVYQVALRSPALARIRPTPSVPDSATQDQSDGCCAELRQRLRLRSRRTTRTAGRYARYGCSAVADGPLRPRAAHAAGISWGAAVEVQALRVRQLGYDRRQGWAAIGLPSGVATFMITT